MVQPSLRSWYGRVLRFHGAEGHFGERCIPREGMDGDGHPSVLIIIFDHTRRPNTSLPLRTTQEHRSYHGRSHRYRRGSGPCQQLAEILGASAPTDHSSPCCTSRTSPTLDGPSQRRRRWDIASSSLWQYRRLPPSVPLCQL